MNDLKILSVIVPVFNGQYCIDRLVESIVDNNKDIIDIMEIILVDDCSEDDSYSKCVSLSKEYSNIVVLKNEVNSGIATTRNKGVASSSGKFITFCDQDDTVHSGYLQFVNALIESKSDMIATNHTVVYNGVSTLNHDIKSDVLLDEISCGMMAAALLTRGAIDFSFPHGIIPNTVWNCIFSKEVIMENNVSFHSFVDFEDDWVFLIEFLSKCSKIVLKTSHYYSWNVSSNSKSHTIKYVDCMFEKRVRLKTWVKEKIDRRYISEDVENIFVTKIDISTIKKCCQNSALNSFRLFKYDMVEICNSAKRGRMFYLLRKASWKEKVLIFFLALRLYTVCYVISRYANR